MNRLMQWTHAAHLWLLTHSSSSTPSISSWGRRPSLLLIFPIIADNNFRRRHILVVETAHTHHTHHTHCTPTPTPHTWTSLPYIHRHYLHTTNTLYEHLLIHPHNHSPSPHTHSQTPHSHPTPTHTAPHSHPTPTQHFTHIPHPLTQLLTLTPHPLNTSLSSHTTHSPFSPCTDTPPTSAFFSSSVLYFGL